MTLRNKCVEKIQEDLKLTFVSQGKAHFTFVYEDENGDAWPVQINITTSVANVGGKFEEFMYATLFSALVSASKPVEPPVDPKLPKN